MGGQTDRLKWFHRILPTKIEHPKTEEDQIKMKKTNPTKHTHTKNEWVDKLNSQGLWYDITLI